MATAETLTPSTGSDLVVGIDIGATKTHIALGRDRILTAEEVVSTSSWRTTSLAKNAQDLLGLVRKLVGEPAPGIALGVGAHGCDSTQQCLDFEQALSERFAGPVRIERCRADATRDGTPGAIGVVSGTGSIGVARDAGGHLLGSRVGGDRSSATRVEPPASSGKRFVPCWLPWIAASPRTSSQIE